MAKKQRTDYGSFDFDSELEFDFDFDEGGGKASKKSMKPIDHIADGVKSSMRNKFTDPYHIRSMIKKALPEGLSDAWDAVDVAIDTSNELYEDAVKEIRPHLGGIARKLDQLTPDTATRAKRFTQMLKDKVSPELPAEYAAYQSNAEDMGIQRMFAEMESQKFQVEESRRRNDQARAMVSDRVAGKRFDSQQKVLGIIANETMATRRFLTTFNISYQKKSLELQYRSYAALNNISQAFAAYVKHSTKFQNALLVNTSLPEYAKTTYANKWSKLSGGQKFGRVATSMFKGTNRIISAGNKLKKLGKEKILNTKEFASMFEDALESAIDARDMDKDMAEMEGRQSSGWRTTGVFGGDMLGEIISDYISEKIKGAASKNKGLMSKSFTIGRHALNPGGMFDALRQSKWYKGLGSSGNEGGEMVKNFLSSMMGLFSDERPDMTIKNTSPGAAGENKIHTQERVARSLTDIIPGYLARILREVTIARTGNAKTGLLTFDYKSGHFKTEKVMSADLIRGLRAAAASNTNDQYTYSENVNSTFDSFTGGAKMSESEGAEVKRFLAKLSRSREDFEHTGPRIKQTKEFKALSPDIQKIVSTILDERFTGNSFEATGNQYILSKKLSKTKASVGNLMGPIQEMIQNGQGPMLAAQGIIRRNKDNDWDVDEEAYHRIFDDTITSDINMKTNIRPSSIDGKKAINGFKNTKMYDWNYKGGKYSQRGFTGPMAQDIRKNFGNGAAPGGRSIDLVNMNGHMTAAIKKLAEMVESMGAGDAVGYLKNISENIGRISGQGGLTGGAASGLGGSATSLWGHAGALLSGLGSKVGGALGKAGRTAGSAASTMGKFSQKVWAENKEDVKAARDSAVAAAIKAAGKAASFGSDLIFNKTPAAMKTAKGVASRVIDEIKNTFQKVQDVYVAGKQSPAISAALLQAGYYKDQATGNVLRTLDDITKAKGNIVDALGNVKLSVEDRASGLLTGAGEKLKGFAGTVAAGAMGAGSFLLGKAGSAMERAIPAGKSLLNKLGGLKDNVSKGLSGFGFRRSDPRVVSVLVQIRDLIAIGKRGPKVKEILSRDINKDPDNTKFSAAAIKDTAKGILDNIGDIVNNGLDSISPNPSVSTAGQTVSSVAGGTGMGGILGSIGGLFGAGKRAASGLFNAGRSRFPGKFQKAGGFFNRIGGLGGGRLGRWGNRGRTALGKAGNFFGGIGSALGGMFQGDPDNQGSGQPKIDENGTNTYSASSHANRLMQLMGNKASSAYKTVTGLFGDRNGDGQRDGGAADRMEDYNRQKLANEERKQAGIEAAKKGADAKAMRNSPADNAIEKMIKMATAGISAIAESAGSIMDTAGDLLGDGEGRGRRGKRRRGRGRGRGGKAGKVGRFGRALGATKDFFKGRSILGTMRGVGSGILNVTSKLPGMATIGRVGMGAMRAAQVVGLMGGSVGAVLGSAATAIGSAVSSPVVIGAAAIAATGYAAYKLYKYATRNSIDDYQKIRILQYGLDGTEATKSYNGKVIALENYILDGKLAFSNGTANINGRATNPDEIRELFDISKDDKETAEKFASWYENRFRVVFLHHVNKLYKVDNKAVLNKVQDLKPDQMLEYLSGAQVDDGWDAIISPFKGLTYLNSNPKDCEILIEAKLKEASIKVNDKSKAQVKSGAIAPKGAAAAALGTTITAATSSVQPTVTPPASKILPPGVNQGIPANSRLASQLSGSSATGSSGRGGVSEDGPGADKGGGKSTSSTINMSGMGTLKVAGGPLADGSQGMQYVKLGKDADIDGIHPRFKQQFLAMAQEYGQATGKSILINEGFRSYKRQEQLWRQNPGKAARPGGSMHEFGLAMDINTGIMNELEKMGLLRKYGFTRPVRGETWHMEPAGLQQNIQLAKKDPNFADQAIQASLGRGGGGVGSTPNAKKGGRDPALAKALFESAGDSKVELSAEGANTAGSSNTLPAPRVGGQDSSSGLPSSSAGAGGGRGTMGMSGTTPTTVTGASSQGYAAMGRGEGPGAAASIDYSGSMGGQYGDIKSVIAKSALEAGADPNEMMLMAAMESSLNPNAKAKTSSAKGLNQFIDGTWKEQINKHGSKYGLANASPMDPRASTLMAAEYMKSNNARIQQAKGAPLDMVDKYMGHMFGAGGASSFMRADPNSIAADINPAAARANRNVFYNGGKARTVGELRELLDGKLRKKAGDFGIQYGGSVVPSSSGAAKADSATVAYTPSGGSAAPMSANTVAGMNVGAPSPTMYTDGRDSSVKSSNAGFDAPVSKPRAPMAIGAGITSSRDTTNQVSGELFDRLQSTADTQVKHLSSIDTAVNAMVPLLQVIADNTGGSKVGSSTSGGSGESNKKAPEALTGNGLKRSDSSSFDNRRVIAMA